MPATAREQWIYGADVEIVSRDDDHTVYRIRGGSEDSILTSYRVFPGIELVYQDIHIQTCALPGGIKHNVIEIHHCREGQMECQCNNTFYYVKESDLAITRRAEVEQERYYPASHYHGLSIFIDIDTAPSCMSAFLEDVLVSPQDLAEKFCPTVEPFVLRNTSCFEHIFSELYAVPERIRKGYFKIKVLELLLFLSNMDHLDKPVIPKYYSSTQVSLAKSVCRYLEERMDHRVTIIQLADLFHVSQTKLKASFKGVYGVSIYAYIRMKKMQKAAQTLVVSDQTILEVASLYGYDNASKFAKAFKDITGCSPHTYRDAHRSTKLSLGGDRQEM